MSSRLLWDVLAGAYQRLGFAVVGDETFMRLVLARIIEPTSKADTIRVLDEIGVAAPGLRTIFRSLDRCVARDYRDAISKACVAHSTGTGMAAMVMYDVTTLHFEAEKEDALRRVGMSKEHRVDPQVQVGLLVDPSGFPLEIHMFEGNKAETKTLIPVLTAFAERHAVADMVVVADAGMLSAANVNALEDAGFSFIVGSRITKAPYDLAEHFHRHGDYFADAQILESTRVMGTGKAARPRRVVYQYKFKRYQPRQPRDQRDGRAGREDHHRCHGDGQSTLPESHRRHQGARPGPHRPGPPARRPEGLRHEPAARDDGRPDRDRRLPRPLPGRTVLPDGQERPESTAGLPPPTRSDRSAPHSRVRRSRRRPSPSGRNWRQPEETRPHAAAPADRHHRHRGPHDRRQASTHRRRPTDPREAPAPHGVTNLARVRSGGGLEGNPVAEGFEVTDVVAFGPFGTEAVVVEVGAEVVEAGRGVG